MKKLKHYIFVYILVLFPVLLVWWFIAAFILGALNGFQQATPLRQEINGIVYISTGLLLSFFLIRKIIKKFFH
jgi:uncharacterized membrane protein